MDSESGTSATRMRGWTAVLTLGILITGLFASLYVLVGSPTRVCAAQADSPDATAGFKVPHLQAQAAPPVSAPARMGPRMGPRMGHGGSSQPSTAPAPLSPPATLSTSPDTPTPPDAKLDQAQMELEGALDELRQSRENLTQAGEVQRRTLTACALFLAIFVLIAVVVVIQIYLQARSWNKRSLQSVRQVEEMAAQLEPLRDAQDEVRGALPKLLQEVGEQPLDFQEVGTPFVPKSLAVLDDIDHLAYLGDARLSFGKLSSPGELAVYLNGLLLSAVAHLARSDPWTAFARFDHFFDLLARHPEAVDRHRIAQACSYRALVAYQVLEAQDKEPSWLRKSERLQTEALSKQAFADVAQANRLDSEWKHATFVEALLCSRFYMPDEASANSSRAELYVRGLRRAITLYKELIDEKRYRGPARHNLARCLKRIAEQTGEKSDFSDFGYALSAFPTDEELADEALAGRQPNSQDRFLWQWMLSDQELFHAIDRLNLAEYRSFWIRLLDNKVHLRNWRADLAELQQADPAMRNWSVQLLHVEGPISLANTGSRRQERFDAPSAGT